MNQDQPSPDRAAVEKIIRKIDVYDDTSVPDEEVTKATDAILGMLEEHTRATNIRQIENWRDWLKPREDLQWLVKDMDEAIAALKDATQTDANGVWLAALSKGADKDE
jgi:DNA phosphorothioation-dependent restriction protein DptG